MHILLLYSLGTLWGRGTGFFEERMRIELNPVTRTPRLAGGLNTMLIYFPFVGTAGYDPTTSDVSDQRSTDWATYRILRP